MSSQSVNFDSFMHVQKRFAQTAKGLLDPLAPKKHFSLVAPAYPIKRELSAQDTVAFASEFRFKFPATGYLHGVGLKSALAAITGGGDYAAYPGLVIVSKVELRSDNETLHQYDYLPVIKYWLTKMKNEEAIDKILLMSGGVASATPGTVITPIPTFFDTLMIKNAAPLNLARFNKPPELVITTRTLANSATGVTTGGAISTMKLICYMSETSSALKLLHKNDLGNFHKSIDFYTNIKNNATSGTTKEIDISGMKGNVKKVLLSQVSVTNYDTNKVYFTHTEIDSIKTRFDGHEEWVFRHKEEAELDYMYLNYGNGFHSTLGYPYIIPYGFLYTLEDYAKHHIGGVHSAKVHKNELVLEQSVGANQYIDVCGLVNVFYKYVDGNMVKLK